MTTGRNVGRSGPNRREYQRAHYLAARLIGGADPTETSQALLPPHPDIDDLVDTAAAYADLHARQPTARSGHQLFAAILAVGRHVAADADRSSRTAISITGCARPTTPPAAVTAARRTANEDRAQWMRIRGTDPAHTLTDDDLTTDASLPPIERRWRRRLLARHQASTAAFLTIHRQACGRDDHWAQRAAIRTYSYATTIGTDTLGQHCLTSRARDELDELYRTHRATLPGPNVCASVHQAPLAVGENALLTGELGGLVGDGWRTPDPHHRAFILGTWRIP
ncbi:hypothetical protein [Gordonia sihwensis]|uniref:hypothetical protein n=1 Tax=Gordonia sihwensis TaxID=173559 RepID=UPI0005EF68C6|nr:hypothetical protein [Gordonia sihwensis]KJR10514.1 hypothetical protein UG54_00515 [Gordonia sihwensis]